MMNQINFNSNKIAEICKKHDLKLLVLHGSRSTGRATGNSDIDVGIMTTGRIDSVKYHEILNDFTDIFGDKFDPVFLNGAEPMISYHVAVNGRPLFENCDGAFADFRIQAMGRYMDTKKFRELEKHYIKRAVGGVNL